MRGWSAPHPLIVEDASPAVEVGAAARPLSALVEAEPQLVYEAHSTDYQRPPALRAMVRDHFAVLKVGPALTFAFREAVFALAAMEDELLSGSRAAERSRVVEALDQAMLRSPEHWLHHYHGTAGRVAQARKFSLSDRSRYYWADMEVRRALERLVANLGDGPIPSALLSCFMPRASERIRAGALTDTPEATLLDAVDGVLVTYSVACTGD